MKICLLTDTWYPIWGGGQEHILQISKCMIERKNVYIDIFTQNLIDTESKVYAKTENLSSRIRVFRIGKPRTFNNPLSRLPWWIEAVAAFQKLHRKHHYDLLHAHAYTAAIPAKAASLIWQLPLIFTVHGMLNQSHGYSFSAWFERMLFTQIRYNGLITVSQDFLKVPNVNRNIKYIPNGVVQPKINHKKVKFKKTTLLYVGRLEEQKRVDLLLKALPYVRFEIPDVQLICIGNGSKLPYLRRLAKKLNVADKVQFLGTLPNSKLADFYQKSHLLVLPSQAEGFPLVLLEAWSFACPVLTAKVGEVRHLIKHEHNGFLTDLRQADYLARQIVKALRHPRLINIGKQGKRTSEMYTWESAAEKHWRFYQHTIRLWKNKNRS
ncbi:glycosyltransferase family 1 protein [Candidatus Microgenomates bacterium]|nr:MAG: glycosyltransferase family 1 protein [Candidatus Microgenomates bacterium]